ncbi:MAG: hypothetical protein LAP85_04790 [Acidobacteriia bacterium]|nr:hypothetical protein [Terriglobia bacterium]
MNIRRMNTKERRRWICDEVKKFGLLTFADIQKQTDVKWQSLKGDADLFEQLGLEIRMGKGEFYLVSPDRWTYQIRQSECKSEKEAIGTLAGGLIWGTPDARENIQRQLSEAPAPARETAKRVLGSLAEYWRKSHRFAALDAGTTTAAVARFLKMQRAPDAAAALSGLRVLTNCHQHVIEFLASPRVTTDVITLGGALRKDTQAQTGLLSELCWKAWDLRLDVSIIGTTTLLTHRTPKAGPAHFVEGFACDSEDEARTKSEFLSRSDLKCIVMDSSKFERQRSSAFCFAPLSPVMVDLIITDDGSAQKSDAVSRADSLVEQLWGAGVAVLVAKPVGSGGSKGLGKAKQKAPISERG